MIRRFTKISIAAVLIGAVSCAPQGGTPSGTSPGGGVLLTTQQKIKRGEYLTTIMACGDCHTPGGAFGAPDQARKFSGQEVGWSGPWGVTYGRNLTPDSTTGIGSWTEADIVKVFRTGTRPDGRVLGAPMRWPWYALLTDEDAGAIAAYLKSLPAIPHKVPEPVKFGEKVTGPVVSFPEPPSWDVPVAPAG